MDFEWDINKAESNEKKHEIGFLEAASIFGDPLELTIKDPDHSHGEFRFLSIGCSSLGNLWWSPTLKSGRIIFESSVLAERQRKSVNTMSKTTEANEMRPEYDFSGGVRGKHHSAYQQGSNLVLLDPDIAAVFKDSESVNRALRMLMELAGKEMKRNLPK